ncbi:MAG: galactokinase [Terriglobia bacterium]|nr:MAG: galactokinase [Terriglobia bacterium]
MTEEYRRLFGTAEGIRIFRAPGRVNLIGEHTDYNLGFVLPMALQLATFIATAPAHDGKLRIFSEHKRQLREWSAAEIANSQPAGDWTDYPVGVARELAHAGFAIEPANLLIRSTVPEGSGLSSSAALEVSCALALLQGRAIDRRALAQLCQRAEHRFVGIPSGIMDQYVSLFGHQNSAIELDCRSLDHRLVRLPEGIALLAINTMVKHALAGSAYRQRVEECAQASRLLGVESLRDVSPEQLAARADSLPEVIRRRARHVVSENQRVHGFVEACERNDPEAMGKLLVESHRSLQLDYEVSCAELDYLVERALAAEGVFGARMTGGGFGGCVVTLLRADALPEFSQRIAGEYRQRFGVVPQVYTCRPSAGAEEVNNFEIIPAAA